MKKLLPLLLALCCLLLCACASTPKEKEPVPEPEALVAELLASGAFTEEMTVADDDVGRFLYALEDLDAPGLRFCFSSGAVAEEIAVLPCADGENAQTARSECSSRLDNLVKLFTEYKPDEVPKLEKAMILQRDNTVVFCVAADAAKAKAVLDKYF